MEEKLNQEILEELREISQWTKVIGRDILLEKIKKLDDKAKVIYELSTPSNSLRDIAEKIPLSRDSIGEIKRQLYKKGLMERRSVRGGNNRYVRIDSLEDFGIDVPEFNSEEGNNGQ